MALLVQRLGNATRGRANATTVSTRNPAGAPRSVRARRRRVPPAHRPRRRRPLDPCRPRPRVRGQGPARPTRIGSSAPPPPFHRLRRSKAAGFGDDGTVDEYELIDFRWGRPTRALWRAHPWAGPMVGPSATAGRRAAGPRRTCASIATVAGRGPASSRRSPPGRSATRVRSWSCGRPMPARWECS